MNKIYDERIVRKELDKMMDKLLLLEKERHAYLSDEYGQEMDAKEQEDWYDAFAHLVGCELSLGNHEDVLQ